MKTSTRLILVLFACLSRSVSGEEDFLLHRWTARFDVGGTIPQNPTLTVIGGPVTGGDKIELSAGSQMDLAIGCRATPWLTLGGEFGLTFNRVESVGNWSYPNSSLSQLTMMVNLEVQYPRGPLIPFVGVGGGGVYSTISFGNYYDFYYSDSDGHGSDFVPAFQGFGGLRYEFNNHWGIGVIYRFLSTGSQDWDVDWHYAPDFRLGVDSVRIHSICLMFNCHF